MAACRPWCSGQCESSTPTVTLAWSLAMGSMVLITPTLAPASSTSLPDTSPDAVGKVMVNWCGGPAASFGAATATPTPPMQRGATAEPTASDLVIPLGASFYVLFSA